MSGKTYDVDIYDVSDEPGIHGCWISYATNAPESELSGILADLLGRSYDTVSIQVLDGETGEEIQPEHWPEVNKS